MLAGKDLSQTFLSGYPRIFLRQEEHQVKHVAISNHNPEVADVLHVLNGDELSFERRKTIYPGWIWCTDGNGTQAWVPEAFVTIDGSNCRMNRTYISQEIVIEVGEVIDVIETESAWAWVCNREGQYGWIPVECLERFIPADISG